MPSDPEMDELVRKRQRNRVAQQNYRKRIKSQIEDLKKKAAVADRLVKGNESLLSEDLASPFGPSTNPQMNARGSPGTISMDILQGLKASAAASALGESPAYLQRKLNSTGGDSGLNGDDDFLRGLALSAHDLSGNQNTFFTDMGIVEIQEDNVKALETIQFSTSTEAEATSDPTLPSSDRYGSSTVSTMANSLLDMPAGLDQGSLEARVDHVLRAIKGAGFSTLDTFLLSFYTASFRERSTAKKAQETSHSRGLPMMLDELRSKSDDWPVWQSRAYTDSIVRSAAHIIADEFDRLTKKKYQCEKELEEGLSPRAERDQMPASTPAAAGSPSSMQQLHSAAAELRKTLRNELPNLNALTAMLSSHDAVLPKSARVQLLVATINMIAATGDEPLEEVANWVHHRVNSEFSTDPSNDRSGEDFEEGSYMLSS